MIVALPVRFFAGHAVLTVTYPCYISLSLAPVFTRAAHYSTSVGFFLPAAFHEPFTA